MEGKDIQKKIAGIIILILIITGLFSGCVEQSQNLNKNDSSNNSSVPENQPPIASCSTNNTFGYVPFTVSFIGSGIDADGMIISYYWDFGDGNISFEQNPNHIYNKTGTYSVILTVSDDDGASDNDTIEITVISTENNLPTSDFTFSPSSPSDLDIIQFTDESTDSDGSIISWFWNFGDEDTSTLQNPTHEYADNGTFNVTLTIIDDYGESNSTSKEIIVNNIPPTASFTYNPSSPSDSDVIQFTDKSTDSDGTIISWVWDFGDGDSSSGKNPSHQYVISGMYEVKLTVKDDDDSVSETSKEIIVNEQSKEINNDQSNDDAILTITYNGEHKTYTLEDLENMVSVTGYGGRLNSVGSISGPFEYKGVSISTLANEFSSIPMSYTLRTISNDGYTYTYTQNEIQGNVQVYDTEGNKQGIGGVTMILAYTEEGIKDFPGGPLRIAFVDDEEQLTDSFLWSKYVIEIKFLDV